MTDPSTTTNHNRLNCSSSHVVFQFYRATIKDSAPIGTVSLDQFFEAIRNPKPHIRETFAQIKQAELDGDNKLKAELKTRLFSFTPAVMIGKRRAYSEIKSFTGLMPLDFDHVDPAEAIELRDHIFNDYPYIIASWLSPSGSGVRALVNIPICQSPDEYKSYFDGLVHYSFLGKYRNFDHAPKNCVLPLFLSYDPEIAIGDCDVQWDQQYHEAKPAIVRQYKYEANPSQVTRIVESAIGKITSNGHPQLRAASFALGGYVGAGYIDLEDAIDLINELIDSNDYLSAKPSVYKKTAKTMITKGITQPLYL